MDAISVELIAGCINVEQTRISQFEPIAVIVGDLLEDNDSLKLLEIGAL